MSVSHKPDPRANQKRRTRGAIVDAANELLAQGVTPTIATVADHAQVSRATAYRYFPTQEALLSEILEVSPTVTHVDAAIARFTSEEPEERMAALLDLFVPIITEHEGRYRAALRVYLDTWFETQHDTADSMPIVREGRRLRWIDDTLAPTAAEMSAPAWWRLRAALALVVGVESIVVLKDVCGLTEDEILDVLRWTAAAIVRAGTDEAPPAASGRG